MKTVSIHVSNLCVPCENRCRYFLLSWDGNILGVDYDRSVAYARRFYHWIREKRPELSFAFYYGYSMEHPKLLETLAFLQETGSPGGKFLQLDGLKFRTHEELRELLSALKRGGIELINLTFYGLEAYHDRFAARKGDFVYLVDILRTAAEIGLDVSAGIALNRENSHQTEELVAMLRKYKLSNLFVFVPHSEGRGVNLEPVRLRNQDYEGLPESVKEVFNRRKFRTEGEWVRESCFPEPDKRVLTLGLTPENLDYFENMSFDQTIACLEKLDEDYYACVPTFTELIKKYGEANGECFYSQRDLYLKYQRRYIREHGLKLPDINDERFCFSRRF